MTNPKAPAAIDVLIPVFNAASTLEGSLLSICRQDLRDIRIIVIDDGSTDASPQILARMASDDPRIDIVTTANRGIVDALNTALARSDADFVARFDADDLAFPERLRKQLDYLVAHPDCVAIGCNAFHVDEHGHRTGYTTEFREEVVGDPFHVPSIEPYLIHPFLLVRRDALVAIGGYRYVFHSEDVDLYWRLARVGRLSNIVDVLGEYRIHGGSVSAKSVINGRVSAISSQLAAISEQRRRRGEPDLVFERGALEVYQAARSLRKMLDLASIGLSRTERSYLEVATATKLLELTSYRPYRLARDDLKTIRRAIERHFTLIAVTRRRGLVFRQMIKPRGFRPPADLLAITPWRVMPAALWDLGRYLVRTRLLGASPTP